MPRNTCRPSECVANGNCSGSGSGSDGDKANGKQDDGTATTTTATTTTAAVKQEFDAAPPVCHRKSERRKIARDIFLVFEEQPTRRRGRGRGGARGKCTRAKQKFGHLKVANTPRINKNIMREIKTEPKCSTAATATAATVAAAEQVIAAVPATIAAAMPAEIETDREPEKPKAKMATVKLETKTASNATATVAATTATATTAAVASTMPELCEFSEQLLPQGTATTAATTATTAATTTTTATTAATTTPSVNPIFLWVKQDDTRIVEVRCEDYDKRNRIRLTKTTNGWRSMPRTDASSTRIVKFFHSAAAPLMKVKREQQQQQQQLEEEQQEQKEQLHSWTAIQEEEAEEQEEEQEEQQQQPLVPAVIENVVVVPAQQLEADVCFDALLDSETNASTKATKTISTISTISSNSNPTTPTYQSSPTPSPTPAPLELQLCPKTGLFLPQGVAAATDNAGAQVEPEEEPEETVKPMTDQVSLDANTKNLKDLLDDADELLQNCSSDNGCNDDDLLDSLVKRSCEDGSLPTTTTTTAAGAAAGAAEAAAPTGLSSFCVPDVAGKELPSILGMDSSDAPKCLSFNEAGEIEGLHGDLFLGIDAFDKQPEAETEAEANRETVVPPCLEKELEMEMELEQEPEPALVIVPDETPKDLSYKKREEVCPPSESRSQCAVTSSSDILKSKSPEPELLQLPATSIPAEVETTSETIKHLILEQFLKLNGNPQQQAEPMDLGKATTGRGHGDKLHTVVIDDDDDEDTDTEPAEPLKKRPKPIKMDKDPDALTQLKMLIGNPQWKVPDPILVPKDRLGAVLASPAREIPLLLTTRPELRLPEAFAYPEIIQNPNILVVTMEQLEAILRNDQADQVKTQTKPTGDVATPPAQITPVPVVQQLPKVKPQHQGVHKSCPAKAVAATPTAVAAAAAAAALPTSSPAADSSMSTELNATTLALLQQMLWLPYFGQLSQEFFKTLKDPLGLQRKFMSNLLPLYNSQFGLQHLDELYKHCMQKQKPTPEEPATPVPPVAAAAPAATKQSSAAFNGFGNPMELAFMQKLLQQQQQQQQQQGSKESSQQQHLHLEHKRARRDADATPFNKPPAKTTTAAATVAAAAPPATVAAAPPVTEHKPRLTCKSLSNLLEPESNVVPLLNVPFDGLRRVNAMHKATSLDLAKEPSSGRTLRSSKACVTYNPLEHAKQSQLQSQQQQQQLQRKRGNMLAHEVQQQQQQLQQQQQQQQHLAEAAAAVGGAGGGPGVGMDANSALWHPLFGSNPKQGYNSPWQWTTVTATGE
ncbi:hypothetical protein ACLKA7_017382 [Drosophila subpalustris]